MARTILLKGSNHGRRSGSAIHPYDQRIIGGIAAGFKEPKEGVDRIVVVHADIQQKTRWYVNIPGIGFDPFSCLAYPGLPRVRT